MNIRKSPILPIPQAALIRLSQLRRQPSWRDWIALAGVWISFLSSTYISNVPICLLGGVIFAALALTERGRWDDVSAALIALAVVGALLLSSTFLPIGLDRTEMLKGAIGMGLFLSTIIFGPSALRRASAAAPMGLIVLGMAMLAAFLLEYLGLLSLKNIGLVAWADNHFRRTIFDTRPSGLYGEPSWHSLAAASLGYFLTKCDRPLAKIVAAALALSCVISGSSTGLLLASLIAIRLTELKSGSASARFVPIWLGFVSLIILYGVLSYFDLFESDQFQKILNPDKYGSGQSRFYSPLYYLQETFALRPLFGMGFSYISERLTGLTGTAVLPINVFIESGIVGIVTYTVYFLRLFRNYEGRSVDLIACLLCLLTLGLQGSPFQAIMLVCFVVPWGGMTVGRPREGAAQHVRRRTAGRPRTLTPALASKWR